MRVVLRFVLFALQPVRASSEAVNVAESFGVPLGLAAIARLIAERSDAYWAAGFVVVVVLALLTIAGVRLQHRLDDLNRPRVEIVFAGAVASVGGTDGAIRSFPIHVRNVTAIPLLGVRAVISSIESVGMERFGLDAYRGAALREKISRKSDSRTIPPGVTPVTYPFVSRAVLARTFAIDCDAGAGVESVSPPSKDHPYLVTIEIQGDNLPSNPKHRATFRMWLNTIEGSRTSVLECQQV